MALEKIEESKDTLKFLEDILPKSLEGEEDPRIVEVNDTIEEIAFENKIDLTDSLSFEEICTLWNEYSVREFDPTLNLAETLIKESPKIFFIVWLTTYSDPEIAYKILEDHELLIKLGFATAVIIYILDLIKIKIEAK